MHKESRIIPCPAPLMYAVVCDVEQYPQFLPWVLGLRIKSRSGNTIIAEMMVGYKAFREKYTSRILLDPASLTVDVSQIEGPFRRLENHWRFTAQGAESCVVEFSIDFEFRNRLLGAVAGAGFQKALFRMTEAFEARAAALSQPRA